MLRPAYIIILVSLLSLLAGDITNAILSANQAGYVNGTISIGNVFFFLPLFSALFIQGRNYKRFMNLGANRSDFLNGSLLGYVLLAAAVSAVNLLFYYTYDHLAVTNFGFFMSVNLMEVFGWAGNGPAVAFLQQFAFLFFIAAAAHTFADLQGNKIGVIADIALIAIICVFTPIEPLRNVEAFFFKLIIFEPNALLQIIACLGLGAGIYLLNKPILRRKPMI
jgi:hypothetical protein